MMRDTEKDWADEQADACLSSTPVLFNGIAEKFAEALREAVTRGYRAGWAAGERSGTDYPRTN